MKVEERFGQWAWASDFDLRTVDWPIGRMPPMREILIMPNEDSR